MEELDRNLNSWDAVILDAKMFDESEDETPKLDGLRKAIRHIDQLSMKNLSHTLYLQGSLTLWATKCSHNLLGIFILKKGMICN